MDMEYTDWDARDQHIYEAVTKMDSSITKVESALETLRSIRDEAGGSYPSWQEVAEGLEGTFTGLSLAIRDINRASVLAEELNRAYGPLALK